MGGVVALLEACDVTNNGHQFDRHLGFYQELKLFKMRVREIVCALHEK